MPKQTFNQLPKTKKETITKGLLKVFDTYGYDKATVSKIIKACYIPRGSFYQYFEDKYDAFRYLIDVNQQEKLVYLKPYFDQLGKVSFFDLYLGMIDAGLDFAAARPELMRVWMRFYQTVDKQVDYEWKQFEAMAIDALVEVLNMDVALSKKQKDYDKRMVAKMLFRYQSMDVLEAFDRGESKAYIKDETRKFINIIRYGVESEGQHE